MMMASLAENIPQECMAVPKTSSSSPSSSSHAGHGDADVTSERVDQQGEADPPVAVEAAAAAHTGLPLDDGESTTPAPSLQQRTASMTEAEVPYPELEAQTTLQAPASFKPFFTLVEDPRTGEHHHPTVHYMFADDDPDIMTSSALETLQTTEHDERGDASERYVLVDVSADGRNVISTSSLSSQWQGVKSRVTQAPSWGNDSLINTQLMLHISGQGLNARHRARIGSRKKGDVHGLIRALDEIQSELESVVGDAH